MKAVLLPETALLQLCRAAGMDGRDARLIRVCANAVFHLPRSGAVVRIAAEQTVARARRAVRVARWLESIGFPAVRVHPQAPEAVVAGGQVATFWKYLPQPDAGHPAPVRLAPLLRRLHAQAPPFPLPAWDPVSEARSTLHLADDVLRDDDRVFLLNWCDRLEAQLPSNVYGLPYGLVHGDAWVGNLLRRAHDVVMCDFDQVCWGPQEWDLVPTAVNALRFGRPSAEEFMAAYGYDVTAAEGFALLRQVRELLMLVGALPAASSRPSIATEIARRLADLRGAGLGRWTPYP